MNLQIIGDKNTRKVIAVADDIAAWDHEGMAIGLLRRIVSCCGLDDRYQVVEAGELERLTGSWSPCALVAEDASAQALAERFPICVSGSGGTDDDSHHCTTFSTEDDNADFVAKNVRPSQDTGYTFDLAGLGIIGRIHLRWCDAHVLRAALVAASAALSCGVSFANVVEGLGSVPTRRLCAGYGVH